MKIKTFSFLLYFVMSFVYVGMIFTTKSVFVVLVSWVFLAWFVYKASRELNKLLTQLFGRE